MKVLALLFILGVMFSIPGWWRKDGYKEALSNAEWCVNYRISNGQSYDDCFDYVPSTSYSFTN